MQKSYNHIEFNYNVSNKKSLFLNLKEYCEKNYLEYSDYMPLTFHFTNGWINKSTGK